MLTSAHKILLFAGIGGEPSAEKRHYLFRLHDELRSLGCDFRQFDLAGALEDSRHAVTPLRPAGAPEEALRIHPVFLQAVRWHAAMRAESLEAAAQHLGAYLCECLLAIARHQPDCCILWNQFTPLNHVLAHCCRNQGIGVVYGHLGLLPGTVVFEQGGQMGESWVARNSEAFLRLPCDESDLIRAGDYLDAARDGQWIRKPQGEAGALNDALAAHPFGGKKRLFYAGQNDFASGILPEDLPNARLHSPAFHDSEEALRFLAEVAEERDLLVIFKPHPSMKTPAADAGAWQANRVLTVPGANVFACMEAADLTITILSQVAYQALIQERPVLLLGCMQLNGKGCAYEARDRDRIRPEIDRALREGFTPAQRAAWRKHAAQLIRHYLFPLNGEMETLTGKSVKAAAEFLVSLPARNTAARTPARDLPSDPAEIIDLIVQGCTGQAQSYRRYMERTRWRVEADFRFLREHAQHASSMLDLGAVPPLLAAMLKPHIDEVAIADPAADSFAPFCNEYGIQFRCANLLLGEDPFPGRQFDLVCLCEVLEHLSGDVLGALNRVAGKVAPGGLLLVTTPNLRSITGLAALLRRGSGIPSKSAETVRDQYERAAQPGGYLGHVREYSAREVIQLVGSLGLEHVASHYQTHPRTPTLEKKAIGLLESLLPAWRLYGKYLFRKPPAA